MAMVLDAFASYVQNMLTEMVKEEVGMLLGVSGEIDKMGDKLGDLKNFLADADRRNIADTSVQVWVGQLKRAMYDATDILDLCHLKAMERGPSTTDVGCFNPLLFCMRNPLHAHDIGSRIKALNQRLDGIKERSAAFGFINLGSYEDRSSNVHASRPGNASRETSGELDRSGLVGEKIEQDTRALVEIMLTEKEGNNIMLAAIVGVGGIGKTTLAQKVFNDEAIQSEFNKKIWLSVNKDLSETELLRRAITEAGGDHRPAGDAKATLQRTLKDALRGQKLLLVMDDVWNHKAWENVLKIPFADAAAEGSRVLVTTRDERVARGMRAVPPYHQIDKLDDEDAWSLIKKQVVSSKMDEAEIDMLKDIGMKIIAKCDGLPLAVKVMGGLLCQKDKQRRDWEMVLNDSIWSVSEMPEELNYAVYLSYEDLPPCIKQCFLYYSFLPKNALFNRDAIIGMWISEGFIHGTSDDLEELGRKYHKELILRNLIDPVRMYVDQSVCNMHDVVRSFAQFVARDEALAAHSGETGIISKLCAQKFLRLSLEFKVSESDELEWSSIEAQKSLRTLILVGHLKIKPGDSLDAFPSLRTLHILHAPGDSANLATLVDSLYQLKHLRYLTIAHADTSGLPEDIGKLKFLQNICLQGCRKFVKLPRSIVMLGQLRYLNIHETSINAIPSGFCVLTNLRTLLGFPAHVDGDRCSLEELGPLSQLRILDVRGLENVSATSTAAKARLGEKVHLTKLYLNCSRRLGVLVEEEEQQRIEEVFDELCPPCSLDYLEITGYLGRWLPRWMMSSSDVPLKSLRILFINNLACCTQLPDGLCQLPCLDIVQIDGAPSIKRVGPEFLHPSRAAAAFPRLNTMVLAGMVEWEEWEWEEQVQAMPVLKELRLTRCKLRRVPPGLAAHAKALKLLFVNQVQHLRYLENFASLVELQVLSSRNLDRISNLPKLQKITVSCCLNFKVLEGVPALQRLVLEDYTMETLPEYILDTNPRHLELDCSQALLTCIAAGQSSPEWDKFNHVEHVKAYAHDGGTRRKWNLICFEDAQRFESVFKMTRRTFSYVCCLVKVPSVQDMNSCTFVDGRAMCLEDRVAVALTMLNSGDPPENVGSSVGVNESTVLLVTKRFVRAMHGRGQHHTRWPDSDEMEKIKSKFDKIHGLPNCCGVVVSTRIKKCLSSAKPDCDHEKNGVVMQALLDPDTRFTNIYMTWPGSRNLSNNLYASELFKQCEKGMWLNGSKLKISDGSEVGEYIIGDAGCPLLPWLLTPYKENDLSDSPYKAEFNRRHSAATAVALRALVRFKDTLRFLQGAMPGLEDPTDLSRIIHVCCILHNIVIDMEEERMPGEQEVDCSWPVRQLADENAVRARDILSQHLASRSSESGDAEEEQEVVSSGSGDQGKEQQVHSPISGNQEESQKVISSISEENEAHKRTAQEGRKC